MYEIEIREHLDKVFAKLRKKNPMQLEQIHRKVAEIIENPNHYKNLRQPLEHLKSVHVDRSFVLLFSVNEQTNTLILEEFDHHDRIYSKNL